MKTYDLKLFKNTRIGDLIEFLEDLKDNGFTHVNNKTLVKVLYAHQKSKQNERTSKK